MYIPKPQNLAIAKARIGFAVADFKSAIRHAKLALEAIAKINIKINIF